MSAKKTLLSDAVEQYLEQMERKNRSKDTLRIDRNILTRMIASVGDIQTQNVNKHHIERLFYGPEGLMANHPTRQNGRTVNAGVGPATHNQYRNRIKVFFKWCADHDMMTYTTATQCFDRDSGVVQALRVQKKRRQRPVPVVLLSLLEAAKSPRDRAYIATALNLALRANEIRRIKWGDLDLDGGYIGVTISKTAEVDEMMINSDLDPELRRWILQYQTDIGRPLRDDDYLFPTRTGGMISGYATDSETGQRTMLRTPYVWVTDKPIPRTEGIVKRAMESLGLETRYEGTHTIRRAVARAYFDMVAADKGEADALRATAALLHHSSTATTERYLGTDIDRAKRDRRMAGKPFLSSLVSQENVVQLRPKAEGE